MSDGQIPDSHKVVAGYQIPKEATIPEPPAPGFWDKLGSTDSSFWYLKADGVTEIARQIGLDDDAINPEMIDRGTDEDGIEYVVFRSTVSIDGKTVSKVASVDMTENGFADMWSTGETRATRRAIKALLGILRVGPADVEGGPTNRPDDFDPDDGHALADGDDAPSEVGSGGDDDGW